VQSATSAANSFISNPALADGTMASHSNCPVLPALQASAFEAGILVRHDWQSRQ
jgi:hypothetical protein